jgi:hypothetical protein
MVWLYHSPIPVGRKGGKLLVQMISTCRHGLEKGGQHPVGTTRSVADSYQHNFGIILVDPICGDDMKSGGRVEA